MARSMRAAGGRAGHILHNAYGYGLFTGVERRESMPSEAAAAAGVLLTRLVKNSIGVSVDVHVVDPATVERSGGKRRRVVDNRPRR